MMHKRVIRFFTNYEREEQWLNEMAAQGWHCRGYVFGRYLFERGEPGAYTYRIQFLDYPADHPRSAPYLDFLREAGVEVVASCFRWVYLRQAASAGPFELFSDRESRIAHYRKIIMMLLPLAVVNLAFGTRIFGHGGLTGYLNLGAAAALAIPVSRYYQKIAKLEKERLIRE